MTGKMEHFVHVGGKITQAMVAAFNASAYDSLEALVGAVLEAVRPGDQILVMSNGSFGGVHQKLLDGLKAKWQE